MARSASLNLFNHQYLSGKGTQIDERSTSVMIQKCAPFAYVSGAAVHEWKGTFVERASKV